MSQLRLKQILEIVSTNPTQGQGLVYNSSTGKYVNSAFPNTFGLAYEYSTLTSGAVANNVLRFNNTSTPTQLIVSDLNATSGSRVVTLNALTLGNGARKSIVTIVRATDGNSYKSFYVNSVGNIGSNNRTFQLEPIASSSWSNVQNGELVYVFITPIGSDGT